MRDRADNCVVVCSIENLDPMGVHTGDSITVAPAQTLSDVEYQRMRDAGFACIRRIGVDTGGSNIQFAVNPDDGELVVIEMNPRVSRSSALASKATGFPIAKIAARLAVGYTLDEIPNDITRETPASFEPTIDYVVTKVPRWAFEKFPGSSDVLGTRMQSVGEAMAIGRTFTESLQKGLRSLEHGRWGLNCDPAEAALDDLDDDELVRRAAIATPDRPFQLEAALRRGITVERLYAATRVDPWFLDQIAIDHRGAGMARRDWASTAMTRRDWRRAKRLGFSDAQLGWLWRVDRGRGARPTPGGRRRAPRSRPSTRAARSSTRRRRITTRPTRTRTRCDGATGRKVVILGSGPNRIGQGIEFDYCCVHASFALRRRGLRDRDDQLQPRDRLHRLRHERPPLLRAAHLRGRDERARRGATRRRDRVARRPDAAQARRPAARGVGARHQPRVDRPGRGPRALERAVRPARDSSARGGHRRHRSTTRSRVVERVGYPALVRPSYVLGGRAMEIVYDEEALRRAMAELAGFGSLGREGGLSAERPVLIDRFLEDATEVDVDAVRDATGEVVIGAVMEHVEEAGVHSGDSACVIPPQNLSDDGRRGDRDAHAQHRGRSSASSASSTCSTR